MYVCVYVCVDDGRYVCMFVYMLYISMCAFTTQWCVCVLLYTANMYVCMYVCITSLSAPSLSLSPKHTHTQHTHTHTHKHTQIQRLNPFYVANARPYDERSPNSLILGYVYYTHTHILHNIHIHNIHHYAYTTYIHHTYNMHTSHYVLTLTIYHTPYFYTHNIHTSHYPNFN